MKFNDLRIAVRLAIAFATITLLIAFLGVAAHKALSNVAGDWGSFVSVSMEKRESATQGMLKLGDTIHHFKNFLLRGGDYDKKFQADLNDIDTIVAGFGKGAHLEDKERALLADVTKGTAIYREAMKTASEMKAAGKSAEEIDKAIKGADQAIGAAFTGLLAITKEEALATGSLITMRVSEGERWVVILNLVAIALAAVCAWFVSRSITRPLNQAVRIARTVASGDLTSRIEVRYKDECGMLLQALKEMNDSLVRIVREVRTGTDTIATASQQIATGNHDLSARTEEQAGSLEETSSSMQELTATVRLNAEHAREADELARSASEVALKGGAVVQQMVDTMSSIDNSSKKIVDIITVIDGIAFQTNILALNAAVEAARAGEQGRGFAVVAAEVRGLAQRCAAAAKEIKILIDNSVSTVQSGASLASQAGATMEEVVASIKRVTDLIGDMSQASGEESTGIHQINQAIHQIDQITQQNAALVEEAAAASESMQYQAAKLSEVVKVFRVDDQLAANAPFAGWETSAAAIASGHAAGISGSARSVNRKLAVR
jgi:methyl-accepting chemotaxis protein